MALAAPGMAVSGSASANTTWGLLPPSSRVTFFKLPAAAWTMSLPTSVEPVKATLSTPSWAASGAPAVSPNPVTTLTTPSGTPASWMSLASNSADSGVCSAGFSTIQLPVARAGASFQAAMSSGKFHGMIWPTTPRLAQRVGVVLGAGGVGHREADGVTLQLGGPAGHVVEHIRRKRHIGRPGDRHRLAVVEALDLSQLLEVLQDEVADPPHNPAPLRRGHPAPRSALEGGPGGAHGAVDILGPPGRDSGQRFARSRVRCLERLPPRRVDPLTVDEQLMAGLGELLDLMVEGGSGHCYPLSRRRDTNPLLGR